MAALRVEIVTAERFLYSDDVDMIVAPGIEGQLGILPHHAPLMTMLEPGELCLRKGGEIGTCTYDRRAFNVVVSGAVIARNEFTAKTMHENCKLSDHCVPEGDPRIGKKAPDGHPYKACSTEERKARLKNALACAKRVLS